MSLNRGKFVCTSKRVWFSCCVLGFFETIVTDNGRFIKSSSLTPYLESGVSALFDDFVYDNISLM